MRPAGWTEPTPGVFYTDDTVVRADAETVAFLKSAATVNPLRRARLCAHPAPDAAQHDMIIVSHSSTYVPPHRHLRKSESFLVLEGRVTAILFAEDGGVTRAFDLAPVDSGETFFYRMPPGQFHSQVILDDWLVFVESTMGPFVPAESETAPWAPAQSEPEAGHAFLRRILAS